MLLLKLCPRFVKRAMFVNVVIAGITGTRMLYQKTNTTGTTCNMFYSIPEFGDHMIKTASFDWSINQSIMSIFKVGQRHNTGSCDGIAVV